MLDKRTGAGLANIWLHFVGAPYCDAVTGPDGRFATLAARARFHQCMLTVPAPSNSDAPTIAFRLPSDIDPDTARHLVFHVAPEDGATRAQTVAALSETGQPPPSRPLEWRADGKGILCNRVNCLLCGTVAAEEPATGDQKPLTAYESDLQAFFAEIDNTYPFFDLKGIRDDWAAAKRALLPRVRACRSDEEFLQLVRDATKCLRDAHVGIRSARVPVPPPAPRYYPQISFLPANLTEVGRSFRYGKLASGVGYMYLRRVDESVVQGVREALRTYPDAPGWIVDLCGNGGGGYGPELIEQIKSLPRPVAGLIDAGCMSAGETLARDLVLQAQARLFGSRTAGASSAKRTWRFPSGIAGMILPVRSRNGLGGTPIEYHGISPHEEVEVNPEQMRQGINSAMVRAERPKIRLQSRGEIW